MNFGERIKDQRTELHLTQADVAKQLFTTRQTISNWEKGKSFPDLDTLIKISDIYHVSIDSLLKEDQKLKKSLERDTVEKKYGLISRLTNIVGILTVLLISSMMNQPAFKTRKFMLLALAIVIGFNFILILSSHFNAYVSANTDVTKKITIWSGIILLSTSVVLCIGFYLLNGHQISKAMDYTIDTIGILTVTLWVISVVLLGFVKILKCIRQ